MGKGADRPGSRLHKQTLQTLALAGSQLFASLLYVCNMILEGKSVAKSESLTIKLVQPTKTERGGRERELGVFKGVSISGSLCLLVHKLVKVAQSCLTFCDLMDCHSPWNCPSQNTGVGSLSLFQGIFPTQVSCIAGRFFTS